jgi:hypothetical protein
MANARGTRRAANNPASTITVVKETPSRQSFEDEFGPDEIELDDDYTVESKPMGKFWYNEELVPEGMRYQWKRHSVKGMPDEAHFAELMARGWTPVPLARHPELKIPGIEQSEMVMVGGDVLMEIPMRTAQKMARRLYHDAGGQVADKEAQLRGEAGAAPVEGQAPRTNPTINRDAGLTIEV